MTSQQSDLAQRNRLIGEAYSGEVFGAAMFSKMAELTQDPARADALTLLHRLEVQTQQSVRPLLDLYGVQSDEDEARSAGLRTGEDLDRQPWHQVWQDMIAIATKSLDDFRWLRTMVRADDVPIVQILIDHEIVLIDYASKEALGDPASLDRVRDHVEPAPKSDY
ncbi:hypothetical protein [Rhodococcus sp. NBC_00297]|uniref:hypothetical protein n=1 Tax=Rhodococcus sp. NBC_00297 TaxID=2976005 RepID=UPI002E2AA9C2|nr:hypothetical protein [Rhodococcus sp. NBC_00297]